MKNLTVTISEIEYAKFGFSGESMSFSDLVELVNKELVRQNLNKCVEIAEKHGLSALLMDEITSEVYAVRSNAAYRHHCIDKLYNSLF